MHGATYQNSVTSVKPENLGLCFAAKIDLLQRLCQLIVSTATLFSNVLFILDHLRLFCFVLYVEVSDSKFVRQ